MGFTDFLDVVQRESIESFMPPGTCSCSELKAPGGGEKVLKSEN